VDFAFSDEQEMLRASARDFMRQHYPARRVAEMADGHGFPRDEWQLVVDMGWIGVSLPEDLGGAGLSFVEEAILAEELGRGLYPGPWFSTSILGLGVLRHWSDDENLPARVIGGDHIVTLAWAGEDGHFGVDEVPKIEWDQSVGTLTAARLFVPDLSVADLVIVLGSHEEGIGLWIVDRDADGVTWQELPTVDGTRRMGEVVLDRVERRHGVMLTPEADSRPVLEGIRDRALTALAAEAVGVGSAALDLAVGHVRERQQFGRPIGSFQAVSHQLAQSFLELEAARSLAYWAAWAVSEGVPEATPASAAAKARAAEAAVAACERAIQVHGGIGFTWEHPLHRWYKRALGISAYLGWGPEHRARVAAHLLD
jgi:alkylation response protein AidB-like acyl-CoA dehydrogenase